MKTAAIGRRDDGRSGRVRAVRPRLGAGAEAEPAWDRESADREHDDHRHVQPARRARAGDLRQARAVGPRVVPGRGHLHVDRAVDRRPDQRPDARGGGVLHLGRAAGRPLDGHLQPRESRVPHAPPAPIRTCCGCRPRRGRAAHMETLAFYFPVVDGKHAELVLHWGTVVVPLAIDVP